MRRQLQHESKFTADPKLRELNETLMRQQERINGEFDAIQLAMSQRLAPQPEVNDSKFLARPGMHVPVGTAGTLLLAKPTPDTAGQPLAIYNSSGGIVVLDPVDSTINGAEVGWIDAGLHVLYPDASGWFGGFSKSVEIGDIGTLVGNATGAALNLTAPASAPAIGSNRWLLAGVAETGNAAVTVGRPGATGNMHRFRAIVATTVTATLHGVPELETATEFSSCQVATAGTSLLGFLFWLTGGDLTRAVGENAETSGTATTSSLTLTTTRPGAMLIDLIANASAADTATAGSGQTELQDGTAGSATCAIQASYKPMPRPGTTTMDWADLTNGQNHAHIAIVIEPARAA